MNTKADTKTGPLPVRPIPESYWVISGRLLAGEYPLIPFEVEFTRKRLDAFIEAGFDTFVNLTRPDELPDYIGLLQEQAGYYGVTVNCMRFSIGDFGLPSPDLMVAVLDAIDAALEAGKTVYVHCHGGIGRTGTTVGCYLVRHGLSGEEALKTLSAMWKTMPKSAYHPNSPETIQQEKFILNWSQFQPKLSGGDL